MTGWMLDSRRCRERKICDTIVATNASSSAIPDDFTEMVRAMLDFCYLAHSARLSDTELKEMEEALDTFHRLKNIVVRLELMTDESKFDYTPKLHMIGHYAHSIREFGTPDGYNSETPESLHIEFAKKGLTSFTARREGQRLEVIGDTVLTWLAVGMTDTRTRTTPTMIVMMTIAIGASEHKPTHRTKIRTMLIPDREGFLPYDRLERSFKASS